MSVKQIFVSGGTPVKELAGSIIKCYDDGEREIELRAIGAGSVNQMFKACATFRGLLAQRGLDVLIRPGYDDAYINNDKEQVKTVMVARIIVM